MNPVLANPDIKINMSLDEIIHFTRGEINNQLHWRYLRGFRNRKRNLRNRNDAPGDNHSVPLMGTTSGVDIYVSSQSPLLSVENKRRIAQAFSNRAINSNLIEKTKEIIPAEYKLVKTTNGVERVLVPATNRVRPLQKKLLKPRKLKKKTTEIPKPSSDISSNKSSNTNSLPDKPPPLVAAPIFYPTKMEVDNSSDEIIVLDNPNRKNHEVIDLSSDFGDDVLQEKKLCQSSASMHKMTTLNDRFTMLCGSFQF